MILYKNFSIITLPGIAIPAQVMNITAVNFIEGHLEARIVDYATTVFHISTIIVTY